VIKEQSGNVFGAFVSETIHIQSGYYGNGSWYIDLIQLSMEICEWSRSCLPCNWKKRILLFI
jgi:hypothetical protein